MTTRCIAIGASAGGIEAVKDIISRLPGDFPAPVFVVVHIPGSKPSFLPEIFSKVSLLQASHPKDGERIKPGHIYVAPPNCHLLIGDNDHIAVKHGPKENRFRPSIDALFRSAAYIYGQATIGIVLSGYLDDGTSGLWSIKRLGGIAIVQDPQQAISYDMPNNALEFIQPDYLIPSYEIGETLTHLVNESLPETSPAALNKDLLSHVASEIGIAKGDTAYKEVGEDMTKFGELTPFSCPECHGTLQEITEETIVRYRCHTGHAYSESALLYGITNNTRNLQYQVIRSLEEAVMLLDLMGLQLQKAGNRERAALYFAKARKLEKDSKEYYKDVLNHESLSGENIG